MKPQRIVWHHSGTNKVPYGYPEINIDHKKRGFPISKLGYYVGYHYVVAKNGHVMQCRLETETGAHDAGENLNSLGICLLGDFNTARPTEEQAATAAALVGALRSRHNIPISRIEPHRWDDSTDCPGLLLPDNWLTHEYLRRETNPLFHLFYRIGILLDLI